MIGLVGLVLYLGLNAWACRACRDCMVHCKGTKIVPLVHITTLVSYINVPSIIVRSKQHPKAKYLYQAFFLRHPVDKLRQKFNIFWV